MSDMDEERWVAYVETQLPAPCPFRALTGPWFGSSPVRDLLQGMRQAKATFVEVAPSTCRRHAYHLAVWCEANNWRYGGTTKLQLHHWLTHRCLVVAPGYSPLAERFVLLPGPEPWR